MLHSEHREAGIGFLSVIVLQIHVFAQRVSAGKFIMPVPLPRRKIVVVGERVGLRLIKEKLGLKAEVVFRSFFYDRCACNFQAATLDAVQVADEKDRAIAGYKPCFGKDTVIGLPDDVIGAVPEFVYRSLVF